VTNGLGFLLLGAMEVRRDGTVLPVTSSKLRVLLATLLLSPGRTVPIETIIHRLWGDDMSPSARSTVHVYALRLRKLLGGNDVIQTKVNGYAIDVAASQIDIGVFADLLALARSAGDPASEVDLLTRALALWRGPALADVPSDLIQQNIVPRLNEERIQAVERRAELGIELGRHDELVSELTELTVEHPLRERLWAVLMRALARSGRKAEALAAYQQARRVFADELGVDPGEALQQLHQEILTARSASKPSVRPAQLPPDVRAFVGRTGVVKDLLGELNAGRMPVVIVTGPPGVGKTALALHVAHQTRTRFPDGQLYVNLRGYSPEPPLPDTVVLGRFLHALGVPDSQIPSGPDDQTNLYRSLLAGRRVLVVLDNASGPGQVRRLLPGGAGCAVLITSRDDLRGLVALDDGQQVALEPLPAGESNAVLAGILGATRVGAEPAAAAALAQLCAGLPLALRIAAANLRTRPHQPIAGYVAELGARGRLNQLSLPGDTAVRAAFDLSYERLDPDAARMFRRMSLAPGLDIAVPAAAALLGCPVGQAAMVLDTLAAANLVFASGAGRYQVHDLLREYAAEQAGQDPEAGTAVVRLLDFYLLTADAASRLLYPRSLRAPWSQPHRGATAVKFDTEAVALAWFDDERVNLGAAARSAHAHGLHQYAWHIADATSMYFSARGHAAEALVLCEAALAAARASGDACVESYVLDFIGSIYFRTSDYAIAERHHREALALGRSTNDLYCQIKSLRHLGRVSAQLGRPDRTIELHQDALELAVRSGHLDEQALNTNYIGLAHQSAGRPEQAVEWHDRALELSVKLGDESMRCRVHNGLGLAAWHRGDFATAIAHQREAIDIARALGDKHLQAASVICLAEALCAAGDPDQAIAEATGAVGLATGERRIDISAAEIITTARAARGEQDGVVEDYLRALGQAEEIDFRYGRVSILIELAAAHRRAGALTDAGQCAQRALGIMRDSGMLALEQRALAELARCRAAIP
jgi:DNA-binding SARP family transcriptional activator/DNA polymerase III delta prime subunit